MRTFPLADVLAITTGRLVCPIDNVYAILNHITGDSIFTHVIGRAIQFAAPAIVAEHPELGKDPLAGDLAELTAALDGCQKEDVMAICECWVDSIAKKVGYTSLALNHVPGWGSMNPIAELVAMRSEAH